MIELERPYPPSVNHYWLALRGRVLISRKGRAYRAAVAGIMLMARVKPLPGPLAINIELYPPDVRRRDADNALKALNDSRQHGGAFHDDLQIVWLLVEKAQVVPGGKVIVRIAEKTCKPLPFPMIAPLNLN